jgi:hypothetical protein
MFRQPPILGGLLYRSGRSDRLLNGSLSQRSAKPTVLPSFRRGGPLRGADKPTGCKVPEVLRREAYLAAWWIDEE